MGDGVGGAGAELDEVGGGLFAEGVVGHLHSEVLAEGGFVAFEEGPVESGEGAGVVGDSLLGVVLAVTAEVRHFIDVRRAGDVGFGGGEAAVGVGGHAEHIGLDDPVVGVDVGEPEPVGQLAGGEAAEGGEVGEDHEAGDVVGPAFVDDLLDDGVHAVETGGDAPVDSGKGEVGVEGGGDSPGVGVWIGIRGCGFGGLVGGGFLAGRGVLPGGREGLGGGSRRFVRASDA